MNEFPRGPTTTSMLVTSSSIQLQKWLWPGLLANHDGDDDDENATKQNILREEKKLCTCV